MNRWSPFVLVGCLVIGYVAGTETAVRSAAPAEQQPAAGSPWPAIPLAPDQGEPVHWSADDLRQVHTELSARSEERILSQPFDLLELPFTRTHFFNVVHRPQRSEPPVGEQHEGVTDIYFVLGGAGTVTVGGEMPDRRTVADRPGEFLGPIRGGRDYAVHAGDVLSIPPNVPHASSGAAEGLTYMLLKVNVGLYPWSLVSGAR